MCFFGQITIILHCEEIKVFITRLLSGIVLMIIAIASFVLGGPLLLGVLLFCSLSGMLELYRVFDVRKGSGDKTPVKEGGFPVKPFIHPLTVTSFATALVYYLLLYFSSEKATVAAAVLGMLIVLVVYVLSFPSYSANSVQTVVFGFFYVAVMLSFIYRVRCLEGGKVTVWLTLASSWGADTCAYLAGRAFGRHKMSPVLSPKKSVEGAVGGVAGAALIGFLLAFFLREKSEWIPYAVICAGGAVISIFGDLTASAFKRDRKCKDYGRLIPGHGGILDRFDSVIFTAPVIYFLSVFFMEL